MRNWKKWIKAAGIRAIKTVAQTAIAYVGTTYYFQDVNIVNLISCSCLAGLISLLTSLAGIPEEKE